MTFRRYLKVTKPGIIMGNLIATAGGFFLASQGSVDYTLLLATLLPSGVKSAVVSLICCTV